MEAEVVIPLPEFHASTLISLRGLPAQLHLNLIICKVKLSRCFLIGICGVRGFICRFCVLLHTIGACVFLNRCTLFLPIVYFLQGRLRQGATYRRPRAGSRRQICRPWATNLSLICWGERVILIPAHVHRGVIIRQTPDARQQKRQLFA